MLLGVELNPEQPRLYPEERGKLAIVQPDVVKVRFPAASYLREIAELVPGVQFLTRPTTEGYTAGDMVDGYLGFHDAMATAGLMAAWLAHEVANEPNRAGGTYGANGFDRYLIELDVALETFYTYPPHTCSPGLQPFTGTREWARHLADFPGLWFHGLHVYWQGDDYSIGLDDALSQVQGLFPERVIVTEIGDSSLRSEGWHTDDPEEVRADRVIRVLLALQARGVHASILFLLASHNPQWGLFAFSLPTLLRIFNTVRGPKEIPVITTPLKNKDDLQQYAVWALARIENDEEPRDLNAFVQHLKTLGKDSGAPYRYGWPAADSATQGPMVSVSFS